MFTIPVFRQQAILKVIPMSSSICEQYPAICPGKRPNCLRRLLNAANDNGRTSRPAKTPEQPSGTFKDKPMSALEAGCMIGMLVLLTFVTRIEIAAAAPAFASALDRVTTGLPILPW